MKIQKQVFTIILASILFIGCAKEIQKENVELAISGMTCEIGCAKTIQAKLSKKEGVLEAKVVFKDSIANIEFDANTTSKKDLIAFVDGIAGGELYKASESSSIISEPSAKKHECSADCKEKCEMSENKMECKEDCEMARCKDKKA